MKIWRILIIAAVLIAFIVGIIVGVALVKYAFPMLGIAI